MVRNEAEEIRRTHRCTAFYTILKRLGFILKVIGLSQKDFKQSSNAMSRARTWCLTIYKEVVALEALEAAPDYELLLRGGALSVIDTLPLS